MLYLVGVFRTLNPGKEVPQVTLKDDSEEVRVGGRGRLYRSLATKGR